MADQIDGDAAIEGEGPRQTEDDVVVPPSNDPDAMSGPVIFENSRILLAVMVPQSGGGNLLCTLAQTGVNQPFAPAKDAEKVNDTLYGDVLAGSTATDGRLALIATRQSDGGVDLLLQHMGESAAGPTHPESGGPEWEKAIDLGLPAGATFTKLQMGQDSAGRLVMFGLTETGDVWWLFRNPPRVVETKVTITPPGASQPIEITVPELRPADPPFSDWQKLAGPSLHDITMTNNADGRVILFGSPAGAASLMWNEPRAMNPSHPTDWRGWNAVAEGGYPPFSNLTASIDRKGAVNVFALDESGEVAHVRQQPPGGDTWSGYLRPGLTQQRLVTLDSGLDGNGNIALAATTAAGVAWVNQEERSGQLHWHGWEAVAAYVESMMIDLEYNGDGRLTMIGIAGKAPAGRMWSLDQAGLDSTEWSSRPDQLGLEAATFVALRDLRVPAT